MIKLPHDQSFCQKLFYLLVLQLEFHCKAKQQRQTDTWLSCGTVKYREIFAPGLFSKWAFSSCFEFHFLSIVQASLNSAETQNISATDSGSKIKGFHVIWSTMLNLCPHHQFKTAALRDLSHYLWLPLWPQETSVFVPFQKVQTTLFQIDLNNKAMLINYCVSDKLSHVLLGTKMQRTYHFQWGAEHTKYLVHTNFLWLPEQTLDWDFVLECPAKYQSSFHLKFSSSSMPCILN